MSGEPPFRDRPVVHSGHAQSVANVVDPSVDPPGLRPRARRVFEQPVVLERADNHHLVGRDDLDHVELVASTTSSTSQTSGTLVPADGNDHRVLLPVEEHQL